MTLQQAIKQFGEEGVVKIVESHIKTGERRKEYSKSPEAKKAAAERRVKAAAEMAEFRAYKEQKTKAGVRK